MTTESITRYHAGPRSFEDIDQAIAYAESHDLPEIGIVVDGVKTTTHQLRDHDCMEEAVPYVSDGALGHGWECGRCGRFLQAG